MAVSPESVNGTIAAMVGDGVLHSDPERLRDALERLPPGERDTVAREIVKADVERELEDSGNVPELGAYQSRFDDLSIDISDLSEWFDSKRAFATTISRSELAERGDTEGEGTTVPRRIDRFTLVERLGRGGFAEVWRAEDPRLQRDVAVKLPRTDRPVREDELDLFLAEARKMARFDPREGVVNVHEVGRFGEQWYVVTEYLPGGSLNVRADDFDREQRVEIVARLAEILHVMHQRGIVHRDVKPANVLFDDRDRPHLADFGIAVSERELMEEDASHIGTVVYMSPEQARGDSHLVDARSDLYALGVILYELLCGRRPFEMSDLPGYARCVATRTPRPVRHVDSSIPVELDAICRKCLALAPDDRYTTALDLADDIRAWQRSRASEPPAPPPDGTVPTPAASVGQLLPAVGATAVVVAVVVGVVLWQGRGTADTGAAGKPPSPAPAPVEPNDLGPTIGVTPLGGDHTTWRVLADGDALRVHAVESTVFEILEPPADDCTLSVVVKAEEGLGAFGVLFGFHPPITPDDPVRVRGIEISARANPSVVGFDRTYDPRGDLGPWSGKYFGRVNVIPPGETSVIIVLQFEQGRLAKARVGNTSLDALVTSFRDPTTGGGHLALWCTASQCRFSELTLDGDSLTFRLPAVE